MDDEDGIVGKQRRVLRRAYDETPRTVRRVIGLGLFVVQAFVSAAVVANASLLSEHPTLTIGAVSLVVVLLLFAVVYSLAETVEEREPVTRSGGERADERLRQLESRLAGLERHVNEVEHRVTELSERRDERVHDSDTEELENRASSGGKNQIREDSTTRRDADDRETETE